MSGKITLPLLLSAIIMMTGCMISTQEGERTHVNSPHPDEITFHFDTKYNRTLLYGRTVLLLSLAGWLWRTRASSGGVALGVVLAAALMIGAVALHWIGHSKMLNYRIEVRPTHLQVMIPGSAEQVIHWEDIDTLEVEGMATDIRIASGKGQALKWANQWKHLSISCHDGRTHSIDLQPLSTEQRGNLWRAIVRLAKLERIG